MAAVLEDGEPRLRDHSDHGGSSFREPDLKEDAMDAVTLGMTDLSVSPIAMGTWELGGEWATFSERRTMAGAVAFTGRAPETMPTG